MIPELDTLPSLVDGELELYLIDRTLVAPSRSPAYRYEMRVAGARVGSATLRVGSGDYFERYAGQIGYGVDHPHRGKRYAARACRLMFQVARLHGLTMLWITCNPENVASRRTCEILGGELVDIVDVPPDLDLYKEGDRQKCRYRVRL
jgi:tagatose 1,6-diphosphate aldolase